MQLIVFISKVSVFKRAGVICRQLLKSQRLGHWQYSNYLYVVFMMESYYPESLFIIILELTVERYFCYTQLLV